MLSFAFGLIHQAFLSYVWSNDMDSWSADRASHKANTTTAVDQLSFLISTFNVQLYLLIVFISNI